MASSRRSASSASRRSSISCQARSGGIGSGSRRAPNSRRFKPFLIRSNSRGVRIRDISNATTHYRPHWATTHVGSTVSSTAPSRGRGRKASGAARLLFEHALEEFDFLRQFAVVLDHLLDLADRVEDRGVIAAAEAPADLGQ